MGAARSARRRGVHVLLVQAGEIGGECTFTGCVPSKSLIAAAARGADFGQAMAAVEAAIRTIAASEDDHVFRNEGIDVIHEEAHFLGAGRLRVGGREMRTGRVVIATGSSPLVPPIEGLNQAHPLTNENVFAVGIQPRQMSIVGGGPIGCELAQAFQRLGSQVTVIEAGDRLLPKEEPETSQLVLEVLAEEGVDVRLQSTLQKVESSGSGSRGRLRLSRGDTLDADAILVAAGRLPRTESLNLAAAKVETDERGFIVTNDFMETSARGIWAAGDVTGKLMFTHAADYMGRVAAGNALSRIGRSRFSTDAIPWVTFTSPEVGRVGMTEAEAASLGARVAYLPMQELDRAVATGATRGFIKLIAAPRWVSRNLGGGRILGATVVCERGGELVDEVALAMKTRMFAGRLAQTVHAYPTWSAGLQKAAAQFFFAIEGREARPAEPAAH